MAQGPSDDELPEDLPEEVPPDIENSSPEDGPVLSPDELDITESEYVEQIDEGRFVVSPHDRPPRPSQQQDTTESGGVDAEPTEGENHATPQSEQTGSAGSSTRPRRQLPDETGDAGVDGDLTQQAVHDWLRQDFQQADSRYAFDVTATFDGTVSQRRMASNDVVTIFESLLLWYGQQVDSDTPIEEILGILLMESNVPVRYPPASLTNLVKAADLGPEDSIGDLLQAVSDDEGMKL